LILASCDVGARQGRSDLRISKVLIASCVLLLGAAAAQADHAGSLSSHRTLLTFSGPVALPGVSLSAGTYTFELADRNGSPDLVVVRNREQSHVCSGRGELCE
jgi:hypothetical protein